MSPGYKEPPSTPTYKRRLNRAEGVSLGPVGEEQTFTMDETVCQRACRIPIGRAYDDDQVLAMARMSVRYPDADTLLQVPLVLDLKGLFLYTGGILFHVEWCIRQPWPSSIISYSITSIAYNHHTNIYPLLKINI